jgi:hypothetical protein
MSIKRLVGLIFVYVVTCAAWMVLAGVTEMRTSKQTHALRGKVSNSWGEPQAQRAPNLAFRAIVPTDQYVAGAELMSLEEAAALGIEPPKPPKQKEADRSKQPRRGTKAAAKQSTEQSAQDEEPPKIWVSRAQSEPVALDASTVSAELHSDPRRKGLVWYSLYDVAFGGDYSYEHSRHEVGYLDIEFVLPTQAALYDQLVFEVNGEDQRAALDPSTGTFKVSMPVRLHSKINFRTGYRSRGSTTWTYVPGAGVEQLENFRLSMATDFADIDFPGQTLSPTHKQRTDDGWTLDWNFKSTVTGHGMGMVLPQHIQPGELSTALTLSAPISLLFFFFMLFVLSTLQKIDIHPINYMLLGGAFFAFHLLFSYSADHLTVPWAFAISSVVSQTLVVSYLRLVVSSKFALREAALGQLVYLIGFSLAHFWEGFTGLTITVLAIITLFLLMQATGRLRWSEVLSSKPKPPTGPAGPSQQLAYPAGPAAQAT